MFTIHQLVSRPVAIQDGCEGLLSMLLTMGARLKMVLQGWKAGRISTESENVGMIGINYSQSPCFSDGLVHLHCLMQCLLGFALMVPLVYPAFFHQKEEAFRILCQDPEGYLHHLRE